MLLRRQALSQQLLKQLFLDKLTGTVEVQAEGTSATPVTEGLPTPATIQQENNEPVTVNNAPKIGDADYEYQGIESIRHAQQLTDTLMAIDAIFKNSISCYYCNPCNYLYWYYYEYN